LRALTHLHLQKLNLDLSYHKSMLQLSQRVHSEVIVGGFISLSPSLEEDMLSLTQFLMKSNSGFVV